MVISHRKKQIVLASSVGVAFLMVAIPFALHAGQPPPGSGTQSEGTYQGVVLGVVGLLSTATSVIIGLSLVFFLFNVLRYIKDGANEKRREDIRQGMLWGIVALFVSVSVWGLVNLLRGFLSSDSYTPPEGSIIVDIEKPF
ncbi:MAG: hypothetical protein WDZ88_00900 [Candidatus Paceibacterota bacterium]